MRIKQASGTATFALVAALSIASAAKAQVKATATCKLTNTQKGVSLFEGPCSVKQSQSGANTVFEVKMGNAEPFLFAGRRGSTEWMHGADKTNFTDLPNGGIFKWGTFALVVATGE